MAEVEGSAMQSFTEHRYILSLFSEQDTVYFIFFLLICI